MKMTVGPLPAGVYWRRRAIVGGVVLVSALMLWASCGGGSDPADKMTQSAASAGTDRTSAAEPTTTLQVFTTGDPTAASTSSAPAAPPSSAAPQATGSVPACTDAELSLIAVPEQALQYRGAYLKFGLKIKNVSPHECARDVGADAQELYLQAAASKVWSSDACDPPHGTQMSVLKPGIEVSFTTTWNGKATNAGCTNREPPPAGKYELVARLGTKISEPVQIQLT